MIQFDLDKDSLKDNLPLRLRLLFTTSDGNNGVKINGVTNGVIFFSNG